MCEYPPASEGLNFSCTVCRVKKCRCTNVGDFQDYDAAHGEEEFLIGTVGSGIGIDPRVTSLLSVEPVRAHSTTEVPSLGAPTPEEDSESDDSSDGSLEYLDCKSLYWFINSQTNFR